MVCLNYLGTKMRKIIFAVIGLLFITSCVPAESNSSIVGVNQVTVSFDARGGTPVNSIIVDKGSYIDIPESTKIGHTLEGWYTSLNNGVSLDQKWDFFATPININLALFANWNTTQYTITFISNGGSDVPSLTQAYGSTIDAPVPPTKIGHDFNGWYRDQSLTNQYSFTTMPAENLTLYAKWIPNQYTIIVSYETLLLEQFVYVSGSHAVTTNGRLYGWGRNDYGQVGDGKTIPLEINNRSTPTLISFTGLQSGETIQSVSAGSHTLALTTSGRVYAWGYNVVGQLGDGTTTNRNTPTLISFTGLQSGETIQNVVAGAIHSLALTTSGRLYAWGNNNHGQLGDGMTTSRNTPTLISFTGLQSGETIQNVVAGVSHSLAFTTSGRVYAWGGNYNGQLGDGTSTSRNTPTLISFTGLQSGETIQSVVAGGYHSFAFTTSGRVYAWGNNVYGQLGDSTNTERSIPTLISFTGLQSGETINSIVAQGYNSLAVTTSGRVYAWGSDYYGQIGNGKPAFQNANTPTLISFTGLQSGETIQSVAAGSHSLAVTTSGRLYAWGKNDFGELGDGTKIERSIPTIIQSLYFQLTFRVDNYLTVAYDQPINLPNPTLEGYVFEGWFKDKALRVTHNLTLMPSNDVILYAKFTPVVS